MSQNAHEQEIDFLKVWNTKKAYVTIKVILQQVYKLNKMQK